MGGTEQRCAPKIKVKVALFPITILKSSQSKCGSAMAKPSEIMTRKAQYLCAVEAQFQSRNAPGINMYLSARFADDQLAFGPIKIRVAVARAYLNFILCNCELPLAGSLEHVWPEKQKAKSTIKRRVSKQAKQLDTESGAISSSPSASLKLESKSSNAAASSIETKAEFSTSWQHISWRGASDAPSLVFEARPSREFLNGTLLSSEHVGLIEPKGERVYDIALELEIPKSGLLIEDGDQFVSYPNKRGLTKILVSLALCRNPQRIYSRRFYHE